MVQNKEANVRFGSNDSKKYSKEYPYDFQSFEKKAGANKHDNEILSKLTYEPFKKLFAEIDFEDRIKELPKRTRKVVELILEGYNQANIATILNISTRTIKREYVKIKSWLKEA